MVILGLAGTKAVADVITNPMAGISNVTEWAKKDVCWNQVQALEVDWPKECHEFLSSGAAETERRKDAKDNQKAMKGIEAQTAVINAGAECWRELKQWGTEKKLLSVKESGVLDAATRIPGRIPSEKQCLLIVEVLIRMRTEGFQDELDMI